MYLSVMIVCFCVLFSVILYAERNDNITVVKSGIFEFDETLYLGDALAGYAYFKNPQWEEVSTPQGRNLVRFSAEYDFMKEAQDFHHVDFYDEFPTSSVRVVIDFAIYPHESLYFEVSYWELFINGQRYISGDGDFAGNILQNVLYKNAPLNIPIYIEMRSGN